MRWRRRPAKRWATQRPNWNRLLPTWASAERQRDPNSVGKSEPPASAAGEVNAVSLPYCTHGTLRHTQQCTPSSVFVYYSAANVQSAFTATLDRSLSDCLGTAQTQVHAT